jgi:DNA repair protein RadA/Sms
MFRCRECGESARRWRGRCVRCGHWGTLGQAEPSGEGRSVPITSIDAVEPPRLTTGIPGVNRVLGGGLVPGSVVLLTGDPGAGKSTLLMQVLGSLASRGGAVLYVTAEESRERVALRATRLRARHSGLLLLATASADEAGHEAQRCRPAVLCVDSVQTVALAEAGGSAGSVGQVKACTAYFCERARDAGMAVWLIGHIRKDGAIAGPETLQHLVDVVLSLEVAAADARILQASKNRHGDTGASASFVMGPNGLDEGRP